MSFSVTGAHVRVVSLFLFILLLGKGGGGGLMAGLWILLAMRAVPSNRGWVGLLENHRVVLTSTCNKCC